MKKLFILPTLLTISFGALAGDYNLDLFCKKTFENRERSKEAIENGGFYSPKTDKRRSKPKRVQYRGCRYDTNWMTEVYSSVCDGSIARTDSSTAKELNSVSVPSNFLFFFEGAGDFDAEMAKKSIPAVNIDGSEGMDLDMGNANGLKLLRKLYTRGALSQLDEEIELHYHAGSGFHKRENYASALSCAEEIKENLNILSSVGQVDTSNVKWFAMGFSNGGALTIDFQNDLTKFDVQVDLAVTIDPVVQTASYMFHGVKSTIGKKNQKTKRFVNFYQTTDIESVPMLKLRGKPVMEADVNYLMSPSNHPDELNSDGVKNHIKIVASEYVFNSINCELNNLLADRKSTCD